MNNDARTSLEIRAKEESAWSRLLPVLVVVLFITTIAAYVLGQYRATVDGQNATESLAILEAKFSALMQENEKLHGSLEFEKAKSSRDMQIKRQAYEEVARTLASTSREIAGLRENIRFYESIIEGGENKQGLQIKSISLQSDGTVGNYRYRVIIVNSDYGKQQSTGKLLMEIEGLMDGKPDTIKIPTGSAGKNARLLFKYFQRVDGQVHIPEGFLPQRLHLTARLSGKKTEKKEKWYNWDILLKKVLPVQDDPSGI